MTSSTRTTSRSRRMSCARTACRSALCISFGLNSEYVSDGALDLQQLFTRENFSERVALVIEAVRAEMKVAYDVLQQDARAAAAVLVHLQRAKQPLHDVCVHQPDVPDYSVHDLTRIGTSKKKLAALVDAGILSIEDVPDDFELTEKQRNQVNATKTGAELRRQSGDRCVPRRHAVPDRISRLRNVSVCAPALCGVRAVPSDPVPVFAARGGRRPAATHGTTSSSSRSGVPRRRARRGVEGGAAEVGSVVVWNETFEKGINAQLAQRLPSEKAFLDGVNARVVDLMDVFTEQMLVHPAFKGKTSIKFVLPALVPELSYKALAIQEGGTASETWNKIVTGELDADGIARERENLARSTAGSTRWRWWRFGGRCMRQS